MISGEPIERFVRAGDITVGPVGRRHATGAQGVFYEQAVRELQVQNPGAPIAVDCVEHEDGSVTVEGAEDGAMVLATQKADSNQLILCRFYQA